ncbi:hypothetical protein FRB97_009761 [Tulasnella sp. 331]|nr:hypothetical protein FRB97_009761 [Tulasnella sp. 331]
MVEKQTDHKVKHFRNDKGGNFFGHNVADYLKEEGILQEKTTKNSPQSNAFTEHINHKIEEGTTYMLAESKLPNTCWMYAAVFATCIINVTPIAAVKGMTPYKVFWRKKPDLSMLCVFGCHVYKSTSKRSITQKHLGYKCFNPDTNKFIISRDVTSNEDKFPGILWTDEDKVFVPISSDIQITFTPAIPAAPGVPPLPPLRSGGAPITPSPPAFKPTPPASSSPDSPSSPPLPRKQKSNKPKPHDDDDYQDNWTPSS